MRDQLVKFETAVLAKEKGFIVNDIHYWYAYYGKWELIGEEAHHHRVLNECSDDDIRVPTQSLLQKWLRDSFNILLYLDHSSGCWEWIIENSKGYLEMKYEGGYDNLSYEECLEIGLQVAMLSLK